MTLDRAAVAAAVRQLDLQDLASRRWFAAKGEVPSSARLAHAFLLAPDAVLALIDLVSGDRGERRARYAIPFVLREGVVREASEGEGAWRALGAAIAEARAIPAMPRDAGFDDAAAGSAPGPIRKARTLGSSRSIKASAIFSPMGTATEIAMQRSPAAP